MRRQRPQAAVGWLMAFAGLFAPLMTHDWFVAGALTNVLFLLAVPAVVQFDWLVTQPYALAITLGFASLVVLEHTTSLRGQLGAVTLMLLAHWVNVMTFLILGPALVLRTPLRWRSLLTVAAGSAAGLALSHVAPAPRMTNALTPLVEWPHGWMQLLQHTLDLLGHPVALLVLLSATIACAAGLWVRSKHQSVETAAIAFAVGAVHWLVVGTSEWVRKNLYSPRYAFPSLMLFGLAAAILVAAVLSPGPPEPHGHRGARAAIALVALSALLYGVPSLEWLNQSLNDRLGRMTPIIIAAHADVIAGEYWTVWPAGCFTPTSRSIVRRDAAASMA